MKRIKWILIAVVLVVLIAVGAVLLGIDGIVRRTVETQATDSLNLQTTLGGASVSLLGGSLALSDLEIASPKGFNAKRMFALGGAKVGVSFGNLRADPIRIDQIVIDKPNLVIEQANGNFNFQVLMDQASKRPPDSGTPGDGKRDESEPIRLIIQDLAVNNAQVVIRPGIPGLQKEINILIPSFQLKQIGASEGNNNGAAIKEVVMLVVTTLVQKASESDSVPKDVRQLLSLNAEQVKARAEKEVTKQLDKIQKDAGKAIEKGIGDLMNRGKAK